VSVWIVVGGQFGSEGKGKVAAYITQEEQIDVCIRCGGPNSGHSFVDSQRNRFVLRQVPTGVVRSQTRLLIAPGALVDPFVLRKEIEDLALSPDRLGVDSNAMIIEPVDRDHEARLHMRERLSSTLCGVGSATARRVLRDDDVRLAKSFAMENGWLKPYLTDVSKESNEATTRGRRVLVEGTQGFGLSMYHSPFYPKTTSRDTTAAAFLSEAGLSPLLTTEIVLVLRTFPIRVWGEQAGPLANEISWETLQRESGYPHSLEELTTVSQRVRRVGRFDWQLAARAVQVNRPTKLAINGLDYLGYENRGKLQISELNHKARVFLRELDILQTPVRYLGTGPALDETFTVSPIDLRFSRSQAPQFAV
jgi:adenylosuccinate synthase